MARAILVLNAGSSSLKFSLFDVPATDGADARSDLRALAVGQVEGLGTAPHLKVKGGDGETLSDVQWNNHQVASHAQALQAISALLRSTFPQLVLAGVGHRVVQGGPVYSAPLLISAAALETLESFAPLAPLHQPHNLAAIRAVQEVQGDLPQVACFDTAFHRTQEHVADRAQLAIDHFVYRISRELGALAAVLGGIDALVFTAGIGENSARIRQLICEKAAWLGIELDSTANERKNARISTPGSKASAWVLPTNEELMIARHTRTLLGL